MKPIKCFKITTGKYKLNRNYFRYIPVFYTKILLHVEKENSYPAMKIISLLHDYPERPLKINGE